MDNLPSMWWSCSTAWLCPAGYVASSLAMSPCRNRELLLFVAQLCFSWAAGGASSDRVGPAGRSKRTQASRCRASGVRRGERSPQGWWQGLISAGCQGGGLRALSWFRITELIPRRGI